MVSRVGKSCSFYLCPDVHRRQRKLHPGEEHREDGLASPAGTLWLQVRSLQAQESDVCCADHVKAKIQQPLSLTLETMSPLL